MAPDLYDSVPFLSKSSLMLEGQGILKAELWQCDEKKNF